MSERHSNLAGATERLARRAAAAVVARARLANPALNAALLRRLAAAPGSPDAMLADPVFEAARAWKTASGTMDELGGGLLDAQLVAALDKAGDRPISRTLRPYVHQLDAWKASLEEDRSVLVTAGTGAGKTECFLIPILNDLLGRARPGGGVQAILLYPLNALIESQRERLKAWAEALGGRVRFALYNGDTAETERQASEPSSRVELRSRERIRSRPPEILVTNVTMLEYLLLRAKDRAILEASAGALRWMVLDEAHSYVGSQAAEMALLLRRVRAAFGVQPEQVRLMATSATIGGEKNASGKLRSFLAALAGQPEDKVAVIEAREETPILPDTVADVPLDVAGLRDCDAGALYRRLAPHPRVRRLRDMMRQGAVSMSDAAQTLYGDPGRREEAQAILDAVALAVLDGPPLLDWRAHLFLRAQPGFWVCIDPACPCRDPEIAAEGADWAYGAVYLAPRTQCECGGRILELVTCNECGAPHLAARIVNGAQARLETPLAQEADDFRLDAEPDDEEVTYTSSRAWLAPPGAGHVVQIGIETGLIYDNTAEDGVRVARHRLLQEMEARTCCGGADRAALMPLHFGPNFLIGAVLPATVEDLVPVSAAASSLPMGGRRTLTFSDSRQGVARLAAKLQQDAERTLARSFLWHAVQERTNGDPDREALLEKNIAKYRKAGEDFEDELEDAEGELAKLRGAGAAPIEWPELVRRFSGHAELTTFAGDVWRPRQLGGETLADDPERLGEMLLLRELFRRPRVQNNPETMGLVRLCFPKLEAAAALAVPRPLKEAGIDAVGWTGLALATIDVVFRNSIAVVLRDPKLIRIISPRFGALQSIVRDPADAAGLRSFPRPSFVSRPGRLHRMIYPLIGGDPDNAADRDRAADVLDALWSLIATHAARDVGRGEYRIDFIKAAVARLDTGWLCPVTRRPYGYAVAGRSPYSFEIGRPLAGTPPMEAITFPRLPAANAGGLDRAGAERVVRWCEIDPDIQALRRRGLWTDLHDRIAAYPPFLRAQEHSAQIERAVLKTYEDKFRQGEINLLNCSTTMEMGVDIPEVRLVVNANVPPALSNYRQRIGRAGRRGEPWAFGLTFCRELPLDQRGFADPKDFLARPIVAPRVWLDSAPLVERHVNAALLASWIAEGGGMNVRSSVGAFFGAGETPDTAILPEPAVAAFVLALRGEWGAAPARDVTLRPLVAGTALQGRTPTSLAAAAATRLEMVLKAWREEHRALLEAAAGAADDAAKQAFSLRAARLRGEFLLSELAQRGFTPAYGFPTDVVGFDHLSGRRETAGTPDGQNWRAHRGASRSLPIALREYAPGAEIVVDGLVHRSEGVLPAWSGSADASRLEDFRDLWRCPACHSFGLDSRAPAECPHCGAAGLDSQKALRPIGFLGRQEPHTGYEALVSHPWEPALISAADGDWVALADPQAGRLRADPQGTFLTLATGGDGGYAICLDCGRAAPMERGVGDAAGPLPQEMRKHRPLARGKGTRLTTDGYCPGGYTRPERVQKHVVLAHRTLTDVFELQTPEGTTIAAARGLAAGLREALVERLGLESEEIGPAVSGSIGPAGEERVSVYLHDRAAGGASLVRRLAEPDEFAAVLARAATILDCPDRCEGGCPSCVLRRDINIRDLRLDRPAAATLAAAISARLTLAPELCVFGPQTRILGQSAKRWLDACRLDQSIDAVELYLHGSPREWTLSPWDIGNALPRLAEAGISAAIVLPRAALTDAALDLGAQLALHRLAASATLMLTDKPPEIEGAPIVATVRFRGERMALAVREAADALPGPAWATGVERPVLRGPYPSIAKLTPISAERLVQLSAASARFLWPAKQLDGPLPGFGKRFWSWLAAEAPVQIATARDHGITRIRYSDRYLATPLTLALLAETIAAVPGLKDTAVEVALAPLGPSSGTGKSSITSLSRRSDVCFSTG